MPRLQAVVSVCNIGTLAVSLVLSAFACAAGWWVFNKLKAKNHEK